LYFERYQPTSFKFAHLTFPTFSTHTQSNQLHRLYRDSTHFINGVHAKDLSRLNRDIKRMIVIDDDPEEVQLNQENWIRVKPYTDPTDRTDDTLERITPFLIEIAREGYSDIPALLRQYQGMDADEIAAEQDRRLEHLRQARQQQRGLSSLARNAANLPAPELPPMDTYGMADTPPQLTAKDIVGAAPPSAEQQAGFVGWLNHRAKEKEEQNARKMEKWQEIMMKRQKDREDSARAVS
jgi:NLI interacting factor-like phosphatase